VISVTAITGLYHRPIDARQKLCVIHDFQDHVYIVYINVNHISLLDIAFIFIISDTEVFMGDYSEQWKMAKKTGMNALRKFASPQSNVEEKMQQEVCIIYK
jgi:hypothetical protein